MRRDGRPQRAGAAEEAGLLVPRRARAGPGNALAERGVLASAEPHGGRRRTRPRSGPARDDGVPTGIVRLEASPPVELQRKQLVRNAEKPAPGDDEDPRQGQVPGLKRGPDQAEDVSPQEARPSHLGLKPTGPPQEGSPKVVIHLRGETEEALRKPDMTVIRPKGIGIPEKRGELEQHLKGRREVGAGREESVHEG